MCCRQHGTPLALQYTEASGIQEAVLGDDAAAAQAQQGAQDLGALIAALGDGGPQPHRIRLKPGQLLERRVGLHHYLHQTL